MKKWIALAIFAIIITVGFGSPFSAETEENGKLTDEQKQEMAIMHNEVWKQKVAIIEKYVEFGIYTEEKAKKMIDHLKAKYTKLEENDYIPKWDRENPHHMHNKKMSILPK
ncbi:DUF2680 domain-containing protein [Gracilibacillus xinjiangensis]|uniref:DUF2680 domain-containing protein n=1 Tax=Gracilibacillus xinjiangensis TaxID=1193282 RepID=A0ABV8WW12_9BACI